MNKLMLGALCFVFLLSIAGCGSQAETNETDEEMITLTFTQLYATHVTDEWLEANIGTYHQSFERQPDDSIVVKMTREQYADYIDFTRSVIVSVAQNLVDNDHNNITDISYNDDFSAFRVTVETNTLYRSDADSAYFMLLTYGRFYHYLTSYQTLTTGLEEDLEDFPIAFTFLDADGNILEEDYKPEQNA